MTAHSFVPNAASAGRSVGVSGDAAMRLRAVLMFLRDEETRRLARLTSGRDQHVFEEHAAILETVASATLLGIDDALSRLDAGVYGGCEVCGGAIPLERLDAIPHTTTCVGCVGADPAR